MNLTDVIVFCAGLALTGLLYFAYYKVSRGFTLPSPVTHILVLVVRLIAFAGRWLRWIFRGIMLIFVPIMIWRTDMTISDVFTDPVLLLVWIWIEVTVYLAHLLIPLLIVTDVAKGAEQASIQDLQATITELQNTVNNMNNKEK